MEEEKKEKRTPKVKMDTKTIFILILVLVIIALVLFIAFSKNNKVSQDSDDKKTTISKIEDANQDTKTTNEDNNTTINKIEKKEEQIINYDETITKDEKYELTIKKHNLGKVIDPPNTSGYYRYYEATDGHQYLEIVYDYKNLGTSDVRADKVSSIKIKYNDKYDYSGFAVIEDSDGDFTYSNITSIAALSTGRMHYLIEVPDEVANDTAPIMATVKCGQDTYQLNIR